MTKVLGMGNALVDVMTRLNDDNLLKEFNLPKGSMQLVSKEFSNRLLAGTLGLEKKQSAGGSAANTIHGLAHLGVETGFVGKIGKDNLGRFFQKDMEQSRISPMLFHALEETGRSIALISPDSERTFATYLGAAVDLKEEDITSDLYEGYGFFHVEGYLVQDQELIKKALRLAKSHGLTTSIDMASYNVVSENKSFLKQLVEEYVDIVFANEQEAEAFTGKKTSDALKSMAGMCQIAVVKMGIKGSVIRQKSQEFKTGIVEVNSIDSTGAGDLYESGFLYGLSRGLSVGRCSEIGALCGGHVTEVMGAKMDASQWDNIKEKIRDIEQ
jgi:sugar/nucleoside kinase (ribokinase family)